MASQKYYTCRLCRCHLFSHEDTVAHELHQNEKPRQFGKRVCQKECSSFFLSEPPIWLDSNGDDTGEITEGKIMCPTEGCDARLGSWSWSGSQCSCGSWVTPCFQFVKSKLDQKTR